MNRSTKAVSKRSPKPVPRAVLREDTELQMRALIRRRLALPMEKRMNFLRRRMPGRGSCL